MGDPFWWVSCCLEEDEKACGQIQKRKVSRIGFHRGEKWEE
jgi:hypothetical protein